MQKCNQLSNYWPFIAGDETVFECAPHLHLRVSFYGVSGVSFVGSNSSRETYIIVQEMEGSSCCRKV